MPNLSQMTNEELLSIATRGMSNKELLEIAFRNKQKKTLGRKMLDVASGVGAGITNFVDPRTLGQTAVETSATISTPFTDKEAFKETPLFETAGGMAGGAGGLVVGGVKGAIVGGGFGAGIGRLADEGIRKLIGVSDIESGTELAKKVGISTGIGSVGEAIPAGIRPVAEKVLAPLKESTTEAAERALKFFANKTRRGGYFAFGKRNLILRPAQATDVVEQSGLARILDIADNITSGSVFGSSSIARHAKQSADVVIESIDDLFDGISKSRLSPHELAIAVRANIQGNLSAKRQATDRIYNEINERVKDKFVTRLGNKIAPSVQIKEKVGIVDIRSIKNLPKNLQKIQKELGSLASDEQGFNIAKDVLSANDNLTFEAAKNARTGLRSLANNRTLEGKNDAAVGLAKKLVGDIDNAIEIALRKHDPKSLKLWRKANRIYRTDTEQYDNRFIRRVIDLIDSNKAGNPTGAIRAIFKPDNIEEIRRFKRAVDADTFNKAKNWFTRSLFEDSMSPISQKNSTNIIKGENLRKNIAKYGQGKVNDVLGTIYSPKELVQLKAISDVMVLSEAKQGTGIGSMFIQLSQAGAVVNAVSSGGSILSPVLIAPPIMGRAFTNPITAKWLIEGYRLADLGLVGTPQFMATMTRLTAAISNLEAEEHQRKVLLSNPRLRAIRSKN